MANADGGGSGGATEPTARTNDTRTRAARGTDFSLLVFVCASSPQYVYAIPPTATHAGHRADSWNVEKWLQTVRVKVTSRGRKGSIKLEDMETGELYAECPLPLDAPVSTVVGSARVVFAARRKQSASSKGAPRSPCSLTQFQKNQTCAPSTLSSDARRTSRCHLPLSSITLATLHPDRARDRFVAILRAARGRRGHKEARVPRAWVSRTGLCV